MNNFMVSADLRERLEAIASTVQKPRGCTLFRRGDESFGVFIIQEGRVALSVGTIEGASPTRSLGPGCIIGVPGTLSGEGYSLTARTINDCKLAFIPRETLLDFLRRNPQHCFQLVEMLSKEISEMRVTAQRKREKIALLA